MTFFNLFILVLMATCDSSADGRSAISENQSVNDSLQIVEKVYLHTDRVSYYTGDDIWFKAYLVEAPERLLSDHSNNLHVELISPSSKIIDSRIIRLSRGLGNGDFHLYEKLPSGQYRIRAYTNYMRNFSDNLFFAKNITIINPSDSLVTLSDGTDFTKKKIELSFFPEGGSLVDNVTSVVAFKAEDDNGYSHEVSGEIYSSAGDRVNEFKSTHNGMGTFLLNPAPGLKYLARIKNKAGDLFIYEIPESFPDGVVLNVAENRDGEISLIFKTNPATIPMITDRDLSLSISQHSAALNTYSFRMNALNSLLNISSLNLPEGIVTLTLSGADSIPICERLIYIKDNEDVKLNIETARKVYNKRDSVSVKISLSDNPGIYDNAFLSLSATENIFTDNSSRFPSTISSWFLLESDVRGSVEEPSYYFDPSNQNRLKDLDLLLLTQGWRDFGWKYNGMKYPPENGFTISGRVRKKFADVPIANSIINIAVFKNGSPAITTVRSDSSGRFSLEGVDVSGKGKLIASVTGQDDNLKGWLLLDSVMYKPAIVKDSLINTKDSRNNDQFMYNNEVAADDQLVNKNLHTFIQNAEIKSSIQKKYKLSDTITPGEVKITARRQDEPESPKAKSRRYLMGTPDAELIITPELELYNDVFQLLGRYLSGGLFQAPGIKPRKLPSYMSRDMQNPLYLINGSAASKEDVMSLSLSSVERIDVLENMGSYSVFGGGIGDNPIDGVISIILKNDYAANRNAVFHSVNIKFSGYYEPRVFYSPRHHTKLESDYKPDLRTTLFWEPNVTLENNKDLYLNYYNSDNPSIIRVVAEGITSKGIPVSGKTEYEVK